MSSFSASPERWLTVAPIGLLLFLAGCGGAPAPGAVKPAKTELVAHESELLKLTLTADAERRLGLQVVAAGVGETRETRATNGEVIAPPLAGGLPTAAGADLAMVATSQVQADGDIARTRAELEVARKAYARAEALVREEAGSLRAQDEAASALGVAQANFAAAQARRALLGAPVASMGRQASPWVRVSVYAADLADLDRGASGLVRPIGAAALAGVPARPVAGPPTSNAALGTVDLFYVLQNAGGYVVGQRVAVDLPTRGSSAGVLIPASAIVRDIHGGEWVYVRSGPHAYQRQRVEVAAIQGAAARTTRGLSAGAEVVAVGAAELFGVEFGVK